MMMTKICSELLKMNCSKLFKIMMKMTTKMMMTTKNCSKLFKIVQNDDDDN